MELDELKKAWSKLNSDSAQPVYTVEEIDEFRRARSKDVSTWIQNGLILDMILKGVFILAYLVLIILMKESVRFIFAASGIILAGLLLILNEYQYFNRSRELDRKDVPVQESIRQKLSFLKSFYYRIQFMQGLTNPMFVAVGAFYYYYFNYGDIRLNDTQDILVFALLLIISFLFTLPTTLSLYGYHYGILKTSLASLEDDGKWAIAISRYKKKKKALSWLFGIMLFIGLAVLLYLILI